MVQSTPAEIMLVLGECKNQQNLMQLSPGGPLCIFRGHTLYASYNIVFSKQCRPGRVAQSVTCPATDACLTADPGVASLIPARSHTFAEILRSFSSLPLIHSRRVVVSYKRKYVHKLLVNRLFKPAQEKVWLGELTVPQ